MTNINHHKKNSMVHTSSPLSPFSSFSSSSSRNSYIRQQNSEYVGALSGAHVFSSLQEKPIQHRNRHHHRLRENQLRNELFHTAAVTGGASRSMTTSSSSSLADHVTTSPLFPNSNIQKRSFLKNVDSKRAKRKKNGWLQNEPKEDITWRAYRAEYVLHAEIIAHNDSMWMFAVVKNYKNNISEPFCLNNDDLRRKKPKRSGQHYLLFLNRPEARLKSVADPKLIIRPERFDDRMIKRVCNKEFRKSIYLFPILFLLYIYCFSV